MPDLVAEFVKCLNTMSHSRAGWDYHLNPEQQAKEDREERSALVRARAIWNDNPDKQAELRVAFASTNPLATMAEIEFRR